MKSIIKNNIFLILAITSFILFIFNIFFGIRIPYNSIYTSQGYSEDIHENDVVRQEMKLDLTNVHNLFFTFSFNDKTTNLSFNAKLYDSNNNVIEDEDYIFNITSTSMDVDFHLNSTNKLKGTYYLEITFKKINDDQPIKMQIATMKCNGYIINGKILDGNHDINISNDGYVISKRVFFLLLIATVIFTILYFIKEKNDLNKIDDFVTHKKLSIVIYFFVNLILFVSIFLILATNNFAGHLLLKDFFDILIILLSIITSYFFSINIKENNLKIEKLFMLLAIPIGSMYCIMTEPIEIGDSLYHYGSALAPLKGDFSKNSIGYTPLLWKSFDVESHISYKDYLKRMISSDANTRYTVAYSSGIYNFLEYIPSTFGILIGKVFRLSTDLCAYLAKFMNLLVFILLGCYIVKTIPFGKKLMIVYMLNPLFLQQATSISADAMINISSLMFISIALKMIYEKKPLTIKMSLILSLLLLIASIQKPVYLPLALLIIPIMKNNREKNKIKLVGIIPFLIITIVCVGWFLNFGIKSSTNLSYINSDLIITTAKYFTNDPLKFIPALFISTFRDFDAYLSQFLGNELGWLSINISLLAKIFYLGIIIYSIFSEKIKQNIKHLNIYMISASIIAYIAIMLEFYKDVTCIGCVQIAGVQTRYFLPIIILLLLTIAGKKEVVSDKNCKYIISMLLLCHILVMINYVTYFV